ncbi:Plant basic secretory protein (BSP) family protein [Senna tora]|uniref:Plant basic secretory protein (BSP) family protein n=1 Tax=Senna tora TaxID=362788 RepID=A0A834T709_9FABA|nr:Plant basic secretory protein (BSP) family protein [Senna tora]
MAHHYYFSSYLYLLAVTFAATLNTIAAVEYVVTNTAETTPGGQRFNTELGADYAKQTMGEASNFIWTTFQQTTDADRKAVPTVTLFVENRDGIAVTIGDGVHFAASYIENISGDIKRDFNGVLYHEMTHIWQYYGNGYDKNPEIVEGIADFVRLKAGYVPSHWVQPGGGDKWNQGYDVTARFLDYCDAVGEAGGSIVE